MMTSTEMATTQEIETQVEAKQFHEQFCQSDDLPAEQVKGTESKIDTDTTDQGTFLLKERRRLFF